MSGVSVDIADRLEHTGAVAGDRVDSAPSLAVKMRDRHLLEARMCCKHIVGDRVLAGVAWPGSAQTHFSIELRRQRHCRPWTV